MNVIDTAQSAAMSIGDFLHRAADGEATPQDALRELYDAATVLQEIAGQLTIEAAQRDPVLAAAELHMRGELSAEDFTEIMAAQTLAAQGIEDPTPEQIAERVAELNTSAAFVSAIDAEGA